MHKLKPPVVKQTKEHLGKAFNDDLDVKGLPTMVENKEEDTTSKSSLSWSQPNKPEKAYSMSKISCISNTISHQSRKEKQQQPAAFPGIVAWKDMFEDDNLKLPDTSFMNQLRQSVPHEQCQQITDEVVITIEKKEKFCKGTYHTLQDVKKQLYAILTEVMVEKSGYVLDKLIERTKRKLT